MGRVAHNIDRITGPDMKEATDVIFKSLGTGVTITRKMDNPLWDGDGSVKDAPILSR